MIQGITMGPFEWFERVARVVIFFALLAVFSVGFEVAARVGGLWLTREGSAERVRRGNALCHHWGITMAQLLLRSFDARLDVRGAAPTSGPCVIVCNHQSSADIVLLIHALRGHDLKFVAKDALRHGIPFVSVATRSFGHALVGREPSRRDVAALQRMARELKGWNGSAVVFAEGTRSRDGSILPYRTGALRALAKECDLPLLPVAIDGTHVAADLSQYASRMPRAKFTLVIGEAIPAKQWRGDVDGAAARVREWTMGVLAARPTSVTAA